MPVVLLVRHGQASFGAADYDALSDLGRRQSAAVGAELARRGLRSPVATCGTLRRQRDTAALALQTAGLDVEPAVDGRWNEYDHLGLLERYTDVQHDGSSRGVQELLDAALRSWVLDEDGGWSAFSGGALAGLTDLSAGLEAGQDAVVFTSGGILAAVSGALLGLGADGIVALNRVTANGAITKLVLGRGGTTLVSFNDHAHFEGAARSLLTYR